MELEGSSEHEWWSGLRRPGMHKEQGSTDEEYSSEESLADDYEDDDDDDDHGGHMMPIPGFWFCSASLSRLRIHKIDWFLDN